MPWPGTKTRMTVDGATDLVLDEGANWGSYEYTAVDLGAIARYHIDLDFRVKESPASDNLAEYNLEIDLSNDGAAWAGYIPYIPGEFSCRHFKLKVTIKTKPWTKQRPKITRMEHCVTRSLANPHFGQVTAMQNNPPASPTMGCRYIVATGGGAWAGHDGEIAYCSESTTPTWMFIDPVKGNRAYRVDVGEEWFYNGTEWETAQFAFRQHCPAQGYDELSPPAATWAYAINANQDTNGYMENTTADAVNDYVIYKVGLQRGNYDLVLKTRTGPAQGIIKVYLDATLVATFNCFTAGIVYNSRQVQSAIAVAATKVWSLKIKVEGQDPLSAGFECYISYVDMMPA